MLRVNLHSSPGYIKGICCYTGCAAAFAPLTMCPTCMVLAGFAVCSPLLLEGCSEGCGILPLLMHSAGCYGQNEGLLAGLCSAGFAGNALWALTETRNSIPISALSACCSSRCCQRCSGIHEGLQLVLLLLLRQIYIRL